jgi:hypothetical protein
VRFCAESSATSESLTLSRAKVKGYPGKFLLLFWYYVTAQTLKHNLMNMHNVILSEEGAPFIATCFLNQHD